DEHHWNRVVEKTQSEYEDTQGKFWILRERIAVSDREIQVLRQEYREIDQKLCDYDSLREKKGQLAAQLQAIMDIQQQLMQVISEKEQLEICLQNGDYEPEKQAEIQGLDQYIQQLNYSEQDHALARNEVERLRWAEIKQGEIKEAIKRQKKLTTRKPELTANITELQWQIQQEQTNSNCAKEIANLEQQIAEIGYSSEQHNYLRQAVRQGQTWQLRHQQLLSAQAQDPQLRNKWQDLGDSLVRIDQEREILTARIDDIIKQLTDSANPTAEINILEQQIANRRRELDNEISHLGQLKQMSLQLETLQNQYEQEREQLQICKQQQRVYQELAQAFGKNGIQALMIENVLPQLEAEANQLLSRLSANQFHVQFITQKAGRSGKSSKKNAKLIDTLDILIADARGTRSYETYSGGEAFRINFAIRLALAKLLAQRAGASLQLLVVDEGFGTQDGEGCDRLIAAINAISSDFACILTVTHMPHLKEAFQARIEVSKNQQGSQLQLLM
ncbi:MAG: SbcC/MukB-like Walker B domain-containing protein, partial [Dolichospermum sp.]